HRSPARSCRRPRTACRDSSLHSSHVHRPDRNRRTRVDKASRSTVILATGKEAKGPEPMADMNLGMTERLKPIHQRVAAMVRDEIAPLGEEFLAEVGRNGDRWAYTARQ